MEHQPPLVPVDNLVEVYLTLRAVDRISHYTQTMNSGQQDLNAAIENINLQNPFLSKLLGDDRRLIDRSVAGLLDVDFTLRRDGIAMIEPCLSPSGDHHSFYDVCTPTNRSWGWDQLGVDYLLNAIFEPWNDSDPSSVQYNAVLRSILGNMSPVLLRLDPDASEILVRGIPSLDRYMDVINEGRKPITLD